MSYSALLKAAQANREREYELDGLFRTACLWVWKGLDAPGQTLETTMQAMRQEYEMEKITTLNQQENYASYVTEDGKEPKK